MAMRDRLNSAVYGAQRSAIREFTKLAAQTPGCIRLTLGEPDFATPAPICAAAGEALAAGETHYIENNGTLALRERIAAFERERDGLDYAAGDVVVTVGATEALFAALFTILEPGDEVIVPTPAFVLYERIIGLCRAAFVPLDTADAGFQIRPEALARCLSPRTKAIILNSPNNPTGCVLDGQSLRAVYEVARAREIFVICDDVYRQLTYEGDYHSFAEFSDLRDRVIVVQSFSKPYAMTGWRVGYLLADAPVRERLELVHQFMVTSAPAPFQRACLAALEHDPGEMLAAYRERRAFLLERLAELKLPVFRPDGAFYAFPDIRRYGMGSTEFCTRLLREAGLALTPGAAFGVDGYVRISYCCGMDDLAEGLRRLEGFLKTLEGGR